MKLGVAPRVAPWGDLPLSFHPFVELAGGERSLSLGYGSVSLSWWNRRTTFTSTLDSDGILSAEVLVTGDPLPEFRLSGVLRGSARVAGDSRLEAIAGLLRQAGSRRSLAPAGDLPDLVKGLMPRLETRAYGLCLTPRTRSGEGLRFMGSLTYLWWAAVPPRRSFEEIRLTGKMGWSRGERSLRAGTQIRARSRDPQASLSIELDELARLPLPYAGWWTPLDLGRAIDLRPWEALL